MKNEAFSFRVQTVNIMCSVPDVLNTVLALLSSWFFPGVLRRDSKLLKLTEFLFSIDWSFWSSG